MFRLRIEDKYIDCKYDNIDQVANAVGNITGLWMLAKHIKQVCDNAMPGSIFAFDDAGVIIERSRYKEKGNDTELTWGKVVEKNLPLTIEMAYDVLDLRTSFAPMVWVEERYSRDVKPGEVFPPSVLPSRWIEQKEFFMYIDDDSTMAEHGKTWLLFLRKPNDYEYKSIQWKE